MRPAVDALRVPFEKRSPALIDPKGIDGSARSCASFGTWLSLAPDRENANSRRAANQAAAVALRSELAPERATC